MFDYGGGPYDSGGDIHTGDPQRDIEYNRQHFKMPEVIKQFLLYFRSAVDEGLIFDLQIIYENS